ncbi:myogenesis-regulating glycosidase [Lingula anatina]|uniref:Myogenesis-regulating glycosidase n=1 Tax=Lingula anatina TaxID=7574 RepID=A0A1S3IJA5_LINAN|nr:myogenesis-regulating glycosidase [Lingula anatina]|eukprot:XP_013398193.1 myogenesis-regulating glycosidase [Lingula anatina]
MDTTFKKTMGNNGRCKGLVAVSIIVILTVAVGIISWYFTRPTQSEQPINTFKLPLASFSPRKNGQFSLQATDDAKSKEVLRGNLGVNFSMENDFSVCNSEGVCLDWKDARLRINSSQVEEGVTCFTVSWESLSCNVSSLRDCYEMQGSHWYGGAQVYYQYWPIDSWSMDMAPYVAGDSYAGQYGGVIERYWLSSAGVGIFVNASVPLYVSINSSSDKNICLESRWDLPYINVKNTLPTLEYTICRSNNLKTTHEYMSNRFFEKPREIPDEKLFVAPIWSTWALYKQAINQSMVLDYAKQILDNNFTHSQIEIDDDWTPKYGDYTFNKDKFPNTTAMFQKLRTQGFRVTVWVHPFMNIDSTSFQQGLYQNFFLHHRTRSIPQYPLPMLITWWNKIAALLDVTNHNATAWFLNKMKNLQTTYGVSSFKFDGGEVNWLPKHYLTHVLYSNPDSYTKLWAEIAYKSDTTVRHQEVRVGTRTQHLPIFVRMMDKDSTWGYDNGLRTVIPDALTFGLLGYPFVLPDMIGGNAYNGSLTGLAYPSRELFVRWLQVNVFLPSIQFSIPPWLYDDDVINITRRMMAIREQYADKLVTLGKDYLKTGAPIIRPLWWINATDDISLTIDSEFLLGDDLLVAPVLEKGARVRDVYLVPPYKWRDERTGGILTCGWHFNYTADLGELPYFTKISM